MWIPNDLATCALIKILWEYHCGIHGYEPYPPKPVKEEWVRTPTQLKIIELSKKLPKR